MVGIKNLPIVLVDDSIAGTQTQTGRLIITGLVEGDILLLNSGCIMGELQHDHAVLLPGFDRQSSGGILHRMHSVVNDVEPNLEELVGVAAYLRQIRL